MVDFRDLNQRLDPCAVLRLLELPCHSYRWGKWRGKCPCHHSTNARSRSLSVDTVIHRCYCHRCNWTGDLIDLAGVVWGVGLVAAAERLCRHFGLRPAQRRGTV